MHGLFFPVLSPALQLFRPRYDAQLQFLAAQVWILRYCIDLSCIVPTPDEKAEKAWYGWGKQWKRGKSIADLRSLFENRLSS